MTALTADWRHRPTHHKVWALADRPDKASVAAKAMRVRFFMGIRFGETEGLLNAPIATIGTYPVMAVIVGAATAFSNESFVVCLYLQTDKGKHL